MSRQENGNNNNENESESPETENTNGLEPIYQAIIGCGVFLVVAFIISVIYYKLKNRSIEFHKPKGIKIGRNTTRRSKASKIKFSN